MSTWANIVRHVTSLQKLEVVRLLGIESYQNNITRVLLQLKKQKVVVAQKTMSL